MEWTPLEEMTTEAKVDETLAILRTVTDTIEQMSANPMLAAFMPKGK